MFKTILSVRKFVLCFALLLLPLTAFASDWRLIGPEGGDVRSFAYDPANPSRILLGTSAGQMFLSEDGGSSWSLFAHFGQGDDYVLDHIIFDPSHTSTIYVAAWSLYNADEGDVFRSDDGGRTWKALPGVHGKSIRTMAMAPSDPNLLVIGALDGVFRSRNGGKTWERISPENHAEIKNIESLAIDPQNPDIIYAGTWHLPWKTEDGGATWHSISKGIAYDSDMFSIIIDPKTPTVVYASACSGMYKSLNKAEYFHRISTSLPEPAHRTRILKQDPQRASIVYAGTAAGLWKTTNGGDSWTEVTGNDVVVNDVYIDPRNPDHVLAATDRSGVLASSDGFAHYQASNRGFSHRVLGGVVLDKKDPSRIYVGVVNDKDLGGMFISDNGGASWRQSNRGLDDRDILSLQQADNGTIYAGTNHGVFSLASLNGEWQESTMIRGPLQQAKEPTPAPASRTSKSARTSRTTAARKPPAAAERVIRSEQTPRIRALDLSGDTWYAATNDGLFISVDHGRKWYGTMIEGENDFIAVNHVGDDTVTLLTPKRVFLSHDQGKSWQELAYPHYVTGIYSLTAVPDGSFWLGTREGALHSSDQGKTWTHVLGGLPPRNVFVVRYDPAAQRLLATAMHAHTVFESRDGGQSWHSTPDTGVSIRVAMNYQGRLLVASAYNGLLLQQGESGASAETAHAGTASSSASHQ
jgi:photosystem II stability/assembly factor-like uncharacterized protein